MNLNSSPNPPPADGGRLSAIFPRPTCDGARLHGRVSIDGVELRLVIEPANSERGGSAKLTVWTPAAADRVYSSPALVVGEVRVPCSIDTRASVALDRACKALQPLWSLPKAQEAVRQQREAWGDHD